GWSKMSLVLLALGLFVGGSRTFNLAARGLPRQKTTPANELVGALLGAPAFALMPGDNSNNASALAQKDQQKDQAAAAEADEDAEGDDLSAAAVQMDVSKDSPVIRALYQATRETKEKPTLDRLAEAKHLIESGSDVKSVDSLGRTPLHWAVFGSSYSNKASILVAYEEIATLLIDRGVDVNHEDSFQNTALDYMLYSPNFEMQTLLLEHDAASGFFVTSFSFNQERQEDETERVEEAAGDKPVSKTARRANFDLTAGQTLSIQLETPVWSNKSRTGDPVEAYVKEPSGDQSRAFVIPGAKIEGTILFAEKAPDKYSRPRLVIDFSNVVHKNGVKSPLYARVLAVDNARETVRNNEIIGIVQPHANSKVSLAFSAVGMVNPAAGYAVKGVQAVYGASLRREIHLPSGTDMTVQVTRPSNLKAKEAWDGWPNLSSDPEMKKIVQGAPMRTASKSGEPSDLTNLLFIGSEQQIEAAFEEAGWLWADDINAKSALKTIQSTIRQSGYAQAPMSLLKLDGAAPDYVYQKGLDTLAKRHHLRIWKLKETYHGQTVWAAAATHDIALKSGGKGSKWYHRIDSHIDRERDYIKTDLLFAGVAKGYAVEPRPAAPRKLSNATGDQLMTDGSMVVLALGEAKQQPAD
ncbi:MAG: LssY C-terminal domain-containing protein, partial [Candidatus Acidiferrales bacterium]